MRRILSSACAQRFESQYPLHSTNLPQDTFKDDTYTRAHTHTHAHTDTPPRTQNVRQDIQAPQRR